jgi:CheY-like chemotaxis protein
LSRRILVIEDEPLNRKYIGAYLREQGYDVEEAEDGAQAVERMHGSQFDLVVSDIRMPNIDGVTAIAHLRSLSPETPVVIVTAFPQSVVALSRLPRVVVVSKPVLLDNLRAEIRHLLRA